MIWHDLPIAIIDTETTGTEEGARIVEAAAVVLHRMKVVARWSRRVNPGIPIPQGASDVHGIKDEDAADCPALPLVWEELRRVTAGCHFAAYNAPFDKRIIAGEVAFHGLEPLVVANPTWLDPLVWIREWDKWEKGKKLTDACARRGINVKGAHGAFGDALMVARLMWVERDRIPAELADLLAWQEECRKKQDAEREKWLAEREAKQ